MLEAGNGGTRHAAAISPETLLAGQHLRVAQGIGVSRGYFLVEVYSSGKRLSESSAIWEATPLTTFLIALHAGLSGNESK